MNVDMDKKAGIIDVEADRSSVAEGEVAHGRRMPESLASLGKDELERLNKKLLRKIDMLILPPIMILYILNYIDRQNLSAAKLQGIMEDLNITTQQFATAVSILFVGYLPFQIPSNLIITMISRPGMYICTAVVIWGAISGATAAVKSYGQLLAVRAILGIVEAVFFPGAVYFLSAWYPKRELGKRLGFMYIAQQFGNAFGGLFAAAIMQLDGKHGIAGWQWLFIIEGSAVSTLYHVAQGFWVFQLSPFLPYVHPSIQPLFVVKYEAYGVYLRSMVSCISHMSRIIHSSINANPEHYAIDYRYWFHLRLHYARIPPQQPRILSD